MAIHTNSLPWNKHTGMLNSEDKSICLGFSQCTSLNLAQDTNLGLVEIHAYSYANIGISVLGDKSPNMSSMEDREGQGHREGQERQSSLQELISAS